MSSLQSRIKFHILEKGVLNHVLGYVKVTIVINNYCGGEILK